MLKVVFSGKFSKAFLVVSAPELTSDLVQLQVCDSLRQKETAESQTSSAGF